MPAKRESITSCSREREKEDQRTGKRLDEKIIREETEIPGKMIAEQVRLAAGQVGAALLAHGAAWARGEELSSSLGCPGTPALSFAGCNLKALVSSSLLSILKDCLSS